MQNGVYSNAAHSKPLPFGCHGYFGCYGYRKLVPESIQIISIFSSGGCEIKNFLTNEQWRKSLLKGYIISVQYNLIQVKKSQVRWIFCQVNDNSFFLEMLHNYQTLNITWESLNVLLFLRFLHGQWFAYSNFLKKISTNYINNDFGTVMIISRVIPAHANQILYLNHHKWPHF